MYHTPTWPQHRSSSGTLPPPRNVFSRLVNSCSPEEPTTSTSVTHRWFLPVLEFHIHEIMQCLLFHILLLLPTQFLQEAFHLSHASLVRFEGGCCCKDSIEWTLHDALTPGTFSVDLCLHFLLSPAESAVKPIYWVRNFWYFIFMSFFEFPFYFLKNSGEILHTLDSLEWVSIVLKCLSAHPSTLRETTCYMFSFTEVSL